VTESYSDSGFYLVKMIIARYHYDRFRQILYFDLRKKKKNYIHIILDIFLKACYHRHCRNLQTVDSAKILAKNHYN